MFDISSSTYATVRKWEEAGVSLSIALVKYIELSASLGKQSLAEGVPTEFLTTRIDAALASLHNNLGQQLSQTRSVLAQTRNQILSPLHRFPEEILSEIFMHVVFAPQNLPHHEDPKSMRLCIIRVYRALHALMSVCTMWRNTALNRGALWSVVPHLDWPMDPSNEKATIELMMHRAKGTSLKLAVDLRDEPKDTSLLVQHISRFDSMSIVTSSNNNIRDILELFTGQFEVEPLLLSRLSLYRRRVSYGQLSGDAILRSTSEQRAFNRLIQQLTTLQLRHVFFHWDTIKLSSYLTMLHLQEIDLGGDRQIIHLLNALSSAKQLRELTIIKIKTYRARLPIENIPTRCIIRLPNLQWLLIQDLYFNTLHLLLSSIQSRSHQLSIIFTRKSLQYRFQHGDASDDLDIDVVCELLSSTPVHALLVDAELLDAEELVFSALELKQLVKAMPSLETLWLNMWELNKDYCLAIQRTDEPGSSTWPHLVNLYFSCTTIRNSTAFKSMVKSYSGSIWQVALGGASNLITRAEVHWDPPKGEAELVSWLKGNMPKFTGIGKAFQPPEFEHVLWKLW